MIVGEALLKYGVPAVLVASAVGAPACVTIALTLAVGVPLASMAVGPVAELVSDLPATILRTIPDVGLAAVAAANALRNPWNKTADKPINKADWTIGEDDDYEIIPTPKKPTT